MDGKKEMISSSSSLASGQFPYPSAGVAFDFGDHTGRVTHTMPTFLEDIPKHGHTTGTEFDDLVLGSSLGGRASVNHAAVSGNMKEEWFLHSLRDFITEKGGVLCEGWHVELKQSATGSDLHAVYCAPDGAKFESMFAVAHYLGISFGFTPLENDEKSDGCGTKQKLFTDRRRKKDLTRISATHKVSDNGQGARSSSSRELLSETAPQYSSVRSASRFPNPYMEENGVHESKNLVELPVQYKEFFVTCLGKVDLRKAYHDKYHIWPLGYRSSWHDKITGSLFECEVSDGGDSGPVFRVRRYPCSSFSIPNGATILIHNKDNRVDTAERTESSVIFDADYDEDEDILMLLSDPSSSQQDFLSCFGSDTVGNSYGSSVQMDMDCHPEQNRGYSGKNTSLSDEIGEFYVEGRSSSSVWKMVSQTLIDSCREVYKQSGCLQFYCRHDEGMFSSCRADGISKDVCCIGTLARFYGASGPINTPRVFLSETDLEESCKSLKEWLDQDRFGLDIGFVQEIIETLRASRLCSAYQFLNERSDFSLSWTVGSGLLLATQKNRESGYEKVVSYGLYSGRHNPGLQECAEDVSSVHRHPPPGRPLSSNLPMQLVGDIFQISEFLWRFYEILGLKEPLSFEELEQELIDPWPCSLNNLRRVERKKMNCRDQASLGNESANWTGSLHTGVPDLSTNEQNKFRLIPVSTATTEEAAQDKVASHTYWRCTGIALRKAHISLLKVLVGELVSKVAANTDPNLDSRESKPRRGRKKVENSFDIKELKNELLSVNEMTWPELARRYVLAVLSMKGRMESQEVLVHESVKVFRCLQGDGGVLCGSLPGIAGMEADSLLLADAERQINDTSKLKNEVLRVDYKNAEEVGASEPAVATSSGLPDWAKPLEQAWRLPTNVGAKIKKCVESALQKNPPKWAKERLEYSISKGVYKGNACGQTKKAVRSLLADAIGSGIQQQKPDTTKKDIKLISLSDAIMKKCRIVLRHAVSADESKTFCNLLGSTLLNSNDNDDEGILGPPAMVSRPLDFRTIDLRLSVGAYCGSHETFLEDVREVWHNLCIAYGDRPDLMQKIERLSQNFESLYEKEVLHEAQKLVDHSCVEQSKAETLEVLNDVLLGANKIPKAPWEDGVCKICGIDKDDDSVLLCDKCDSEYHKYCLNPPLARIPEGNWYCPSCVMGQRKVQDGSNCSQDMENNPRTTCLGDGSATQEELNRLATMMEEREYWEFSTKERITLLKFLCDEVLNSAIIRQHLEQCADKTNYLQQKLRALTVDWRNLKCKEELLAMRSVNEDTSRSCGAGDIVRESGATVTHVDQGSLKENTRYLSNKMNYATNISCSLLKNNIPVERCLEDNGRADVNKDMGHLAKIMIETQASSSMPQVQFSQLESVVNEGGVQSNNILNKFTIHGNPYSTISYDVETIGQEQIVVSSQQLNGGGGAVLGIDHRDIQRRLFGVSKSTSGYLDVKCTSSVVTNGTMQSADGTLDGSNLPLKSGRTHLVENSSFGTMVCGARTQVKESQSVHQNKLPQGNQVHADVSESEASNLKASSLKNEISQLQDWIASLESQLMMSSLRRDFLGRDCIGRSYWVIGKPGKRPWLVVGGSMPAKRRKETEMRDSNCPDTSCSSSEPDNDSSIGMCRSYPLVVYESDLEIQQLVGWLRDSDPRERELKESILQWQRVLFHHWGINVSSCSNRGQNMSSAAPQYLTTKAAIILENKYGPFSDLQVFEISKKRGRKTKVSNEERMYICECLEPVWPSRHHCLSCHRTYCTVKELEGHNDRRCGPINHATDGKFRDDSIKGKGIRSESTREKNHADAVDTTGTLRKGKSETGSKFSNFQRKTSPFDFDDICKKFVTNNSSRELVKEIGLIGSNGVPSLISSPPMFFDPPYLFKQKQSDNDLNTLPLCVQSEVNNIRSGPGNDIKSPQSCGDGEADLLPETTSERKGDGGDEASKVQGSTFTQHCTIPESSLRPLVGKVSHIVKRLKIDLLNMDAALPEEALRPSRSNVLRRCAWRAYVKSAESIFEMVQATILLELMIRSDYLKNGWWYWSSLTAAAKTPTVSALALRIYTLDDSIIYIKDRDPQVSSFADPPEESLRLINRMVGKKKKYIADAGPSS